MKISIEEMRAFEAFIEGDKCQHGIPIVAACMDCEKEMMIDFVVHNIEEIGVEEAAMAVREGVMTLAELNDCMERRIRAG